MSAATGFGGLLVGMDALSNARAFDLACPVEARQNVRVYIDVEHMVARCPECGSEYDVYSGYGNPVSGPAKEDGYNLRRYRVVDGIGLNYRIIRP